VEGAREIRHALTAGWQVEKYFYCKEALSPLASQWLTQLQASSAEGLELTPALYEKLCLREGSDGLCCVLKTQQMELDQLSLSERSLLLIAEGVEKPGNLGALLRTCDAAGVEALVLLGNAVDSLSPNVIRSSLGARFTVPVVAVSHEAFGAFVKRHGVHLFAAVLAEDSRPYTEVQYPKRTGILLGSEAHGLTPWWREVGATGIQIPMGGKIDSLNVSVAAGILLYGAKV